MRPLFSIIIPVYNGENHISNCLNKLLLQTYKSFEIIIINDGSIDATKFILEKIASKHSNIKVVNKQNEGVSVARNIGISLADGKYILFVDSDDYLENNALDILKEAIENESRDLILFGFNVRGDNKRLNDSAVLHQLSLNNKDVSTKEIIKKVISTVDNILGYIWRACYSKEMLDRNEIRFPKGIKISEDYMFFLNAICHSKRIYILDNELYKYCINDQSMSIKYIPSLLKDMMYVNEWMYKNIVSNDEEYLQGYVCSVCNTYLRYVQNTIRNKEKYFIDIVKEIKDNRMKYDFSRYLKQGAKWPNAFSKKSYISILLFALRLDILYEFLFMIKDKIHKYNFLNG